MHSARLALCLLLALGAPARAQTLELAPEPDWVMATEIPADDPKLRAESEGGEFYLLSDHQMRWDGDEKQSYGRTVAEVTDRAGLESLATIQVDFDPEFESASLVRLQILRDGQVIDLMDRITPQVYRRETRLEEGIIDGTLTAVVQVPDLRVGDVLDHATLLARRPMVGAGERSGTSWLEWDTPVVLSQSTVIWPADKALELGPLPAEVSYDATPLADGTVRHVWRREGFLPKHFEEGVPSEIYESALLRFSDTRDWTPLVQALAPHYTADYPLPSSWEARVQDIADTHSTPEARAFAALRLVQDELRYVSLSVGAGGYFARSPEEVIAAGFGDCKDKSLLLRVMLDRLGVDAVVALTDLDAGHGLAQELPMVGVFDHMILRATLDGRAVWMDPTGTHQGGGLGTATELDYGYALPIAAEGTAALQRMEVSAEGAWAQATRENYLFTQFGLFLSVRTEFRAGSADSARSRWATNPVSRISRDYLDYYLERYPGLLVLRPPEMTDDREANVIVVTEAYFLPLAALDRNGLREEFTFGTENLVEPYPKHLPETRRMPFLISGPWVHRHEIDVRGAPIDFEPPEPVNLSNPAFDFRYSGTASTGGNMELSWWFFPKVHAIAASDVEAVLRDAEEVRNSTWIYWDIREE
ncbi:MAG TPA: DUF3857 domain-containing transglutaminase family protein [Tabrizicola sp.]|nr:DUF3857 domain-containing transglutaminase family protein [Tabrizicola sp.]